MALQRIDAENRDDILRALDQDGGVIVRTLVDTALIETLRDDILKASSDYSPGVANQGMGDWGKMFVGENTIRFSSLGLVTPAYFQLLENKPYQQIADAALLPHCSSYWVNTAQAMLIGPGSDAQILHRDCTNWPQVCEAGWPDCPEVTISAMIALEETSEELGATRVIPGSHRWPNIDDCGDPDMTVPAELSPGDALVYSGKLVHGGGANRTTDRWRNAMHLSFVVGWLTPEECCPLDFNAENLSGYSDRVQTLLGHHSYNPGGEYGGGLWLRHADSW